MSYDKINFVDGQVLTADQLNHMESGIERAIPNPDTAAVGQTIRVSAVDGSGKPTAWEAVDFPSGGGSGDEWELVAYGTLEEDVSYLSVTKDYDGNALSLKKAKFFVYGTFRNPTSTTRIWCNDIGSAPEVAVSATVTGCTLEAEVGWPPKACVYEDDRKLKSTAQDFTLSDDAIPVFTKAIQNEITSVGVRAWNGSANLNSGAKYLLYGVRT